MKISEVRIKLMDDADDRLQAFCSITLDDAFVIRDLKIIDGASGPFVAMPSRKLTAHCPNCGCKNHLRAQHCNQCGIRLKADTASKDQEGRAKLYADIAHPINSECRELIQACVIDAYKKELALSRQPGYVSRYDDYMDYDATAEAAQGDAQTLPSEASPSESITRIEGQHDTPHRPYTGGPTRRQHQSSKSTGKETQKEPDSDEKSNESEEGGFGVGIF